jgi:chromosome segregation ATPase
MSKPAPKPPEQRRVERIVELREDLDRAERQRNDMESELHQLEREQKEADKKRKEEERRKRYGDGKRSLANHLAREVTGGDISWLPFEEREKWQRIAELATDYIADHAEDKP